ncbi:type II secretion system F family protein [Arthrobacter sp. R1-13]
MSNIAWMIIGMIIMPITFIVWSLIAVDRRGLAAVQGNLGRAVKGAAMGSAAALAERPALADVGRRLTPKGYAGWLDKLLAKAGRPAGFPLERFLMVKPAAALVVALLALLVVLKSPSPGGFLLALFVTALAYLAPDIIVHSRGAERQKAIALELPNTLDQMLISVEAGLGFEGAMARASTNGRGPLAVELGRALQDMQVGRSRKDAYLAMAERVDSADLRSFVRSVVRADTYGIAIAAVLRTQAKQMRVRRRQRAEEKAMKLPVKVLFPLMFCILPVLFTIIIGPAAISIMDNYMGKM